jgi:hypothetical protein
MGESQQVTGGCLCGAVRYQAEAFLQDAYYCHCRICQRSSGAPAEIAIPVRPGTLRYTSGRPLFYRSSSFGERGFCATCGSRLVWQHVGGLKPEFTNVSAGSLDDPRGVRPASHQCVESKLGWYDPGPALPHLRSEEIPELVALWDGVKDQG